MRNNQDPLLLRLFAEQDRPLPASTFMTQVVARLEHEQRRQRIYSIVAGMAILAIAALIEPWIAQAISTLGALVAECLVALKSFLLFPLVWLVSGTLAFAFLPVIYVWRTLRS